MDPIEFNFEKLKTYQLSKKIGIELYKKTMLFPKEEKYNLTNQIRRATISISSNLAEGSSRISFKDQARFTEMSYGSLMEIICQLDYAHELGYLNEKDLEYFRVQLSVLGVKLNNFRRSQLKRANT